MINLRKKSEIDKLRDSAGILVEAFKTVRSMIHAGISTEEIDQAVEHVIIQHGAKPAFKGYNGFPASICASIDKEVVHGIPGKRTLKNGETISVDIGVNLDGYFSDAAQTYAVGKISREKQQLMNTTSEALHRGISQCREGNYLSDISHAIQNHVEGMGYSVVRDLVGHGIGTALHEPPQIPNYGQPGHGPALQEGMVFAIEPMVNMGGYEVRFLDDGWTVETLDGSVSAHFEHTIVITEGKPEILTLNIENQQV